MSQTCASTRAVYKLRRSEGEVKCERKADRNAAAGQQSLNSVSLLRALAGQGLINLLEEKCSGVQGVLCYCFILLYQE